MELCIRRAYDEGTSIVIEGVNIIPGLINPEFATLFVVLFVEDQNVHRKMMSGDTHFKRQIGGSDFVAIREIQKNLIRVAAENEIPVVDAADINNTIKQLLRMINKRRSI